MGEAQKSLGCLLAGVALVVAGVALTWFVQHFLME